MKTYNFDEIINREGTNCLKYDARQRFFGKEEVLPLWVADMDFKTPDFVIDVLRKRLDHEILGYTFRSEAYHEAIVRWMQSRHNWPVKKEWISFSPGVVAGLTLAIETFSAPGDEVIVQPPVYTPFFDSVKSTGRMLLENPLKPENGRFTFDLDDLKGKITSKTKLLLLSNPHNPGGTVWSPSELTALANLCLENNILIISDEIHSDLIFSGHQHTPLASLSDEIARNCVVCMSPSKTFNLAGLATSYLIIPNRRLLVSYERTLHAPHLHMGNIFGGIALEAAYTHGADWANQLMLYVEGNYRFLENWLSEHLSQIIPMKPEATYLVWLDFSAWKLTDDELNQKLIEAGVGLNRGAQFGKGGAGHMRLNLGCPRATLIQALERITSLEKSL